MAGGCAGEARPADEKREGSLGELPDRFERRGVSLISVAESLDNGSAAGRLVINIMTAVSQWEREAIGERTLDAMRWKFQ